MSGKVETKGFTLPMPFTSEGNILNLLHIRSTSEKIMDFQHTCFCVIKVVILFDRQKMTLVNSVNVVRNLQRTVSCCILYILKATPITASDGKTSGKGSCLSVANRFASLLSFPKCDLLKGLNMLYIYIYIYIYIYMYVRDARK